MARAGKLTRDRQRRIMLFLENFQEENQYSPSIREIGDHIGVKSTSLVNYYLHQLEESGYITRDQRISRSIRVLQPYEKSAKTKQKTRSTTRQDVIRFPIMGRIVASQPIPVPNSDLAIFDEESYVEIPRRSLSDVEDESELFVLEVSGDSMIDAMINNGDKVVFRHAEQADNGDMVAVWLSDNEETTLKYFYNEGNRIRLQPANPSMDAIYINNPEQVHIMGKVVMVIRYL